MFSACNHAISPAILSRNCLNWLSFLALVSILLAAELSDEGSRMAAFAISAMVHPVVCDATHAAMLRASDALRLPLVIAPSARL